MAGEGGAPAMGDPPQVGTASPGNGRAPKDRPPDLTRQPRQGGAQEEEAGAPLARGEDMELG